MFDPAGAGRLCYRCLCAQLPRKCGTPLFALSLLFGKRFFVEDSGLMLSADLTCLVVLYALIAAMNGGLSVFIASDVGKFDFHTSVCDIVVRVRLRLSASS